MTRKLISLSAVALIIIFGLLAARSLFRSGYFIMHDDLQMMRQLEMEKCFLDGQIPCRWVPDMGYGFGYPLFNFYPPLPYLIGEIFRIFGFAYTSTVKMTFALSMIASGVAMYILAKEFLGRLGAALSAIFYIWAPYHALDVFVRGAMNESWSLVWFPLILWTSYRLIIEKESRINWVIGLSLSWAALLMSHNIMVLIFTPFFTLWCLIWFLKGKTLSSLPALLMGGILALGLASFFVLPAIFEQGQVHINTLVSDYYDFSGHFATLNQLLFSRFWGDGPSTFGTGDGMAFPVGHFHWILSLFIFGLVGLRYLSKKKLDSMTLFVAFGFFIGWFSVFMTHSKSTPIWLTFPILRFTQFPWRFLTIASLGLSMIAGAIITLLANYIGSKKTLLKIVLFPYKYLVFGFLLVGLAAWNWSFFKPVRSGPVTDQEKFSGEAWRLQKAAGINDYLPVSAKFAPMEAQTVVAEVISGDGIIQEGSQGTYWTKFIADVTSSQAGVRINTIYFPQWKVFIDGQEAATSIADSEEWGRMYVNLTKGRHLIYAQIFNTRVRTIGNFISLISWVGLISFLLMKRISKRETSV